MEDRRFRGFLSGCVQTAGPGTTLCSWNQLLQRRNSGQLHKLRQDSKPALPPGLPVDQRSNHTGGGGAGGAFLQQELHI